MPKKFVGMNSKASEAKARRDAVKQEEDAKKKKAIEDELWRDDDKNSAKKKKRKASLLANLSTFLLVKKIFFNFSYEQDDLADGR